MKIKWYDPWFILADMSIMLLLSIVLLVLDLKDHSTAADARAAFRDRFYLVKTTPKNWR